jgi:hypothetical protein
MDTGLRLIYFLQQVSRYKGFHRSHFSLYAAMLMCYTKASCQNPFTISRRVLMKHSGIHSFATYHKCMKDLVLHGFVVYQPSYHPHLASRLWLLKVEKAVV